MTDDLPGLEQAIADGVLTFEVVPDATDPRRDPAGQWRDLLTVAEPSPRHWAMLAAAMRNADRLAATISTPQAARGGRDWYARAVDLYRALHAMSDGPREYAGGGRCIAVPEAIQTWLTAPAPGSDHDHDSAPGGTVTVADRLGIPSGTADRPRPDAAAVARLLNAAQQAGVFGISGHRIELHRAGLAAAGLRLVTRQIHGYAVDLDDRPGASPRTRLDLGAARTLTRVRVGDLLSGDAAGIDAAIGLLTRTAALVNVALGRRDQPPPDPTASPDRRRGRAFSGDERSPALGEPPQRPPRYRGRHR